MPPAIGNNFNRVIAANPITAADVAAGNAYVALNLDLSAGQTALISGFDLLVSVTGADYNNILFVQVIIFKNVNFKTELPVAGQLGAGTEQLYNMSTGFVPERTLQRDWAAPFPLEGPGRYAVYGQAFWSVFAGPTNYALNVRGQIVATGGKPFPLELR